MRLVPLILRLAVGLALVASGRAQDVDWSTYQADTRHRGHVPVAASPSDFQPAWQVQLATRGLGAAVAADGRVFVNVSNGIDQGVYALDVETGQVVWSFSHWFGQHVLPVSHAFGALRVQTVDGPSNTWMRVFDASDGAPTTLVPYQGTGHYLAPACQRSQVFAPGEDPAGLYDFATSNRNSELIVELPRGYEQWTPAYESLGSVYAYVGGTLVAYDSISRTLSYEVVDPNWIPGTNKRLDQAPVIGDLGNVLVTNNSRLVSFAESDGSTLWEHTEFFEGQVSLHDGEIYVVNAGSIDVRSEVDGSLLWRHIPLNGIAFGAILLTDTHAFYCDEDETFALNRATRQVDWTHPLDGKLSLGQGHLLIAQDNGVLTAIRVDPLPTPETVTPASVEYWNVPGTRATITGFGFDEPGATQVWFGPHQAANVDVIDENTLECDVPIADSSQVEIRVADGSGSTGLPAAFTYTPYVSVTGDFVPDGDVQLTLELQPTEDLQVYYDLNPVHTQGQTMPPFRGLRWLRVPKLLLDARDWPTHSITRNFDLPPQPSLSGKTIAVQAIAGPDILGFDAAFSNLVTVDVL